MTRTAPPAADEPKSDVLVVEPAGGGLRGRLRVPGDKSISHRALLLGALGEGTSTLRGLSTGDDVARTATAIGFFGAGVDGTAPGPVRVEGGRGRLHEPDAVVDVGNSGTAIRLLAGWAATIDGLSVLAGDRSVGTRPMERVTGPLRAMGARIDGRDGGRYPPLVVRGGALRGALVAPEVASAQVKGAVLLAGLAAAGETTVREVRPTRTHTEDLLAAAGADVTVTEGSVTVRPSTLAPLDLDVPGDPSQAAFWVVAACLIPGSDLVVENVYVGPGRAGFLDVLARMGADVKIEAAKGSAGAANLSARYRPLVATEVTAEEVPGLIDEIPVLAVAAATAAGSTTFSGAEELRVKESDRIATMCQGLTDVGAVAEPRPDGLVVTGSGGAPLAGGVADAQGDHRVAMALAVAALTARAPVRIAGWEAVATSYPGFEAELLRCR
jgi:3-phosphoshikimate 1-carboxyvinyltransferase